MNGNEAFLKQFGAITEKLTEQSQRVDKSWWGVAKSVENIGMRIEAGWPAAMAKTFKAQAHLIKGFESLVGYMKNPEMAESRLVQMTKERLRVSAQIAALEHKRQTTIGGLSMDEWDSLEALKQKGKMMDVEHSHLTKLNKLHMERMTYLPALIGSFKATNEWVEKQQEALKDSNTSLSERLRLMGAIAQTQRATGASAETLAEASASAVKYGLDLGNSYGKDLTLITKMKEGMGVSSDNSAAMVSSLRLMGQNADKVANSIATLKANTALAADEATRLAKQLTIAMATMAPGGDVASVLKAVGGLEGAAKELGLGEGNVMKIMEGMTKTSGLAGVGMIGMQPDEILASEANALEAFSRIAKISDQLLKGTQGAGRAAQLEQLAELFGTDTSIIASASKIMAKHNEQRGKATTLDEQWRQQTNSFSKSWDKLKNQLAGLTHSVLMPLVGVLQKVVEGISSLVSWLTETKEAAWATGAALGAAGLHTILKSGSFFKGIPGILSSFTRFLPAIKSGSVWFSTIATKLAGIGAAGSALTALLGVLGIGAAGAAGYGIGRLIGRMTGLDNTIQKWLGGGVQSGVARGGGIVAPKGLVGQRDWIEHIANMRASGASEKDVYKWGMDNIKNIKEFQDKDPDKLAWTAKQKVALQSRYFGEGYERQRMLETQATSINADRVVEETAEQTRILKRLEELGDMQVEMARQARVSVQNANEQQRIADEKKSTDMSFTRLAQPTSVRRCL